MSNLKNSNQIKNGIKCSKFVFDWNGRWRMFHTALKICGTENVHVNMPMMCAFNRSDSSFDYALIFKSNTHKFIHSFYLQSQLLLSLIFCVNSFMAFPFMFGFIYFLYIIYNFIKFIYLENCVGEYRIWFDWIEKNEREH